MSKILKPRRGTASVMASTKANTVLAAGEIFFETPSSGVGQGAGKIKMGDGYTPYSALPYFLEPTNTNTTNIEIVDDGSGNYNTAIGNVRSGRNIGELVGSLKKALEIAKQELDNNMATVSSTTETAISDFNDQLSLNEDNKFYFDKVNNKYGFNTNEDRGTNTFRPFGEYYTVASGYLPGVLVANGPRFTLEDGATYILQINGRICTGSKMGTYRGSQTYAISATYNPGGTGTSTTAQAVPKIAQLGSVGAAAGRLMAGTDVYSYSGTKYHSMLGIGSCTTQIGIRWTLKKILGSENDFSTPNSQYIQYY